MAFSTYPLRWKLYGSTRSALCSLKTEYLITFSPDGYCRCRRGSKFGFRLVTFNQPPKPQVSNIVRQILSLLIVGTVIGCGPDNKGTENPLPPVESVSDLFPRDLDWSTCDGILLLNHGLFTFDDDAKRSYEKMIELVTQAEEYIAHRTTLPQSCIPVNNPSSLLEILQEKVSYLRGTTVIAKPINTIEACTFSQLPNLETILAKGGLTPEHVIRIKPFPAIIETDIDAGLKRFIEDYKDYFDKHADTTHIMLDPAPRYAIIKGFGAVALGKDEKEAGIIVDIVEHTLKAMLIAEQLGGWQSLAPHDLFDMEYWELEQNKLKNTRSLSD